MLAAALTGQDPGDRVAAALRRCATDRPEARRFAFVALLDALVQTDAKVPFEEIAPAISELTLHPALLLAARDPSGAEPFLLERFRADEEKAPLARWMLCGNLLATQRTPGFAAHLIGGLRYQVDVLVVDAATTGSPSRTGGGGGGRSGGSIQVPANHPPTACYELMLTPTPGAVVVATGRTPVFAVRKPSRAGTLPLGSTSWANGGRMEPRVHWLAAMLQTDLAAILANLARSETLHWSDGASLQAAAAELRAAITADHERLLVRCGEAGWLGTVTTPTPITFRIRDLRGDRSAPLPPIE
ncbi:MAG: hypothetical protein MUC36_27505 [Planctomycetes bacterium]|nr:hypothetical protein [Planctomycetota bacterium]